MVQALKLVGRAAEKPPLSLELPDGLAFEEWVAIGRKLCLGQQALNWHIGDWWAFGDHRYGDRAKAAAERIFGREFQTLANLASVARSFEPSRRREVLSFTHHAEVAGLANAQPEVAERLLGQAETEGWSKADLRREVQAIKAANDPKVGEVRTEEVEPKSPPQPLSQRELIAAYEAVIEFAEALQQLRALTRREMDLISIAQSYLEDSHADRRPVPDDFDVIFVEKGRIECEAWYRCSRITVNRWLIERGKRRLIEARAAFVRHERDHEEPAPVLPPAIADDESILPLVRKAANFLRASRYGGWVITKSERGGWLVGTVVKTGEQLLAMAERQGFDRSTAEAESEEYY